MSTLPKRPHSRSPESSRRVRQRTQKRSETPEEGEVEDNPLPETTSHNDRPTSMVADDAKLHEESKLSTQTKAKVAFPFKSKAKEIRKLAKVDLVNAPSPVKRRSVSPRPMGMGGDAYRPNDRQNGHEDRRGGRGDSYVPAREKAGSPRGNYERGRPRSRSPPPPWDAWVNPRFTSEKDPHPNGRPYDTYSPPRSPTSRHVENVGPDSYVPPSRHHGPGTPDGRPSNYRGRSRSPHSRDYYPPSPPFRGDYYRPPPVAYHDMYPPSPSGLPARPRTPDRFYPPSRYDDDPRNDGYRNRPYDSRSPPPRDIPMADAYSARPRSPSGPPPPPSAAPPPLPAMDARIMYPPQNSRNDYYPPPPQHGLPPRPTHVLPPRPPYGGPPHGNGGPPRPPPERQPAVYNRPPANQSGPPVPGLPLDPEGARRPDNSSANETKQSGKSSSHKVAKVRTKEEERAAYGREFAGSGRLSEYIMMRKLGEGTFGEVHQARHRNPTKSGVRDLALKRIIMHQERDGMPITALREIKILKALNHPNIVKVLDIVVVPRTPAETGSVFMAFPYMDHDLAGLLENPSVKLNPSHIKLYMKQLLEGLEYMHENHVIHRDIKAANILISNEGILQIADFGLARTYIKNGKRERMEKGLEKYTNCVVTRWYRPPELLLGERYYGAEIDLWGVGCILAEMFVRRPIFQGLSDMDQLDKIWWLCGSPTKENWPDFENLPGLDGVKELKQRNKSLRDFLGRYDSITKDALDLIDSLLSLDPAKRPTSSSALLHEYFWTSPMPADPKTMPKFESSHELDRRRKDNPPAPPPNPHQHQYRGNQGAPFQNGYQNRGMGRGGPNQLYPPGQSGPPHMPPMPAQRYGPPGHMQGPPPMMAGGSGLPPPPMGLPYPPPQYGGPMPPVPPPGSLPQPRGFRPPPRQQFPPPQQPYPPQPPYGQPYGQPYPPGPPGPPNVGPNGMPHVPMGRGPPPPPNDGMMLPYG